MADLWITEVGTQVSDKSTIARAPAQARQKLTIGAEQKSAAFGSGTYGVRLKAVGAACIFVVSAPDASGNFVAATTTVGDYLADGDTEYWGVQPGMKISMISTSGS